MMKKEYITPEVSIEDLEQDTVMIQFSLQTGDDDGGGGAGAKRNNMLKFGDENDDEGDEWPTFKQKDWQ